MFEIKILEEECQVLQVLDIDDDAAKSMEAPWVMRGPVPRPGGTETKVAGKLPDILTEESQRDVWNKELIQCNDEVINGECERYSDAPTEEAQRK